MIKELDQNGCDQEALDMLRLRLQMAKSSVKKVPGCRAVCHNADGQGQRAVPVLWGQSHRAVLSDWVTHEVLTLNGWVKLEQWKGGKIACWNPVQELVSFQDAQSLCFDYRGPMYFYEDKRISQISTPEHKMRVKKKISGRMD